MSGSAIVVMVSICGFVWGGFLVLLTRAVRKEGAKRNGRLDEHSPHPSP
jgi:hypothetical protein